MAQDVAARWAAENAGNARDVSLPKVGHLEPGQHQLLPISWASLDADDREQYDQCWGEETQGMVDEVLVPFAVVCSAAPASADVEDVLAVAELFLFASVEGDEVWFDASYGSDGEADGEWEAWAEYSSTLTVADIVGRDAG